MQHICGGKIDFVSIVKKDVNLVEVTMICTGCGVTEIEKHYLYDDYEKDDNLITVEQMDFTVRTYNTLKRGSLNTLDEIIALGSEGVKKIRNMGTKVFNEIEDKMKEYDYNW